MSAAFDTSVVLRLLTGVPAEQAELAHAFLADAPVPVSISDLVVGETYFALRHHYSVPHTAAIMALSELLADRRVRATGVAVTALRVAVAGRISRTRPGLMDLLIHADYRRDDLELLTFDRQLARVVGARLLDKV